MAHDGGDNLRQNLNRDQFNLADPRRYGFDGADFGGRNNRDVNPPYAALNESDPWSGEVKRISLTSRPIRPTQDYVVPAKVKAIASKPLKTTSDPPMVIRHNGAHYVWDGHHRMAGAMERGQKSMIVRLTQTKTP